MNTGHTWTKKEEGELWNRFQESGLDKLNFARAVADEYGISPHGIRSKLTEIEQKPDMEQTGEFEQGEDFIKIVCASDRMLTVEDVIEQFKVDPARWEVERFKVKTSEGYRKDRRVKWKVEDGQVLHGDVLDTGKMLVVPLYHVEVRFKRKTEEIRARLAAADLAADARVHAVRYPAVKYGKRAGGMLLEIGMPDIHFGRLSWHEESGEDYDVKIAEGVIRKVLNELLSYSQAFKLERILLPIGNDFYNVNSKFNTTVKGTPQQEDTRWQKTFRLGRRLAVAMVEACLAIAPTDVLIIRGNHDEERTFYMGDALECWFHNCKNVTIDNSAKARKYYLYGCNLIGFTHGSEEKMDRLPMLMPVEVPELWAQSTHREIHCGDKHHQYDAKEQAGVVVRILRSLAAADAWTYQRGFVGTMRAGEGFLWDKQLGLKARFTATP